MYTILNNKVVQALKRSSTLTHCFTSERSTCQINRNSYFNHVSVKFTHPFEL
ncbi:MAG: hypothetical protein ACTS4T_01290 [Candidatus Hodgkinia cicadicola]